MKGGVPMKGATETRLPKKALSLLLALALAFCLAVPALAAYPDRPENQYVLDEADVLSEETEQEIIAENQDLFQETGAQIVVVAVDFLDGEDIDDYAYSLFNIWGIGSQERNNGLLLLLAIGEENYYAQAGYGIEDYFDGAKLLIAADCTAYAYANVHEEFMKGKITLIGCPKLDAVDYSEKLTEIFRSNDIRSVTVLRMEVPCCGGLEHAAVTALKNSGKFVPWQVVTISTDGRILDR